MPDNSTYIRDDGETVQTVETPTETPTEGSSCRKYFSLSFGLLLSILSSLMMTTYSSLIQKLGEMDVMQVVVIRGILQFVVMGGL